MYQPKDFYFHKAKKEGYPARSVYKLEELDIKYRLIKKGSRILELGASPGSWLKYCIKKAGDSSYILAVDLENFSLPLPDNVKFIKGDILKIDIEEIKRESPFDTVLSDLAPRTSGMKETDQARSMELVRRALDIGKEVLKKNGSIMVKIFESPELQRLRRDISSSFTKVILERPKAVRKGSSEVYVLGLGSK